MTLTEFAEKWGDKRMIDMPGIPEMKSDWEAIEAEREALNKEIRDAEYKRKKERTLEFIREMDGHRSERTFYAAPGHDLDTESLCGYKLKEVSGLKGIVVIGPHELAGADRPLDEWLEYRKAMSKFRNHGYPVLSSRFVQGEGVSELILICPDGTLLGADTSIDKTELAPVLNT